MRRVLVAFSMPYSSIVTTTVKLKDTDKINFDTIGKCLEEIINEKDYSIISWSEIEE